jgi:hypothetical protein
MPKIVHKYPSDQAPCGDSTRVPTHNSGMNLLKLPIEASAALRPRGQIGRFGAAVHSGTLAWPGRRKDAPPRRFVGRGWRADLTS